MMSLVCGYLVVGIIVGIIEHRRWSEFYDVIETVNTFLRVTFAWPTYLIEDFRFWMSGEDEDTPVQ